MKRFQTGKVVLAVMVVMMTVVWQGKGPMGMGYGAAQGEKSGQTGQQSKAEQPPAPKEPPEPQH